MKIHIVATSCLVAFVAARPQGSIEKDAEWTVKDLIVSAAPMPGHLLNTRLVFITVFVIHGCIICERGWFAPEFGAVFPMWRRTRNLYSQISS